MESQTRTYIEEFLNFHDAAHWLGILVMEEGGVKSSQWVITKASIHYQGGLYKCTFSMSNQREMS